MLLRRYEQHSSPSKRDHINLMNKTYRKGAVGAVMDEYERAAAEFRSLIAGLTEEQYTRVVGVSSPHVSKGSTVDEEPLLTCGLLTLQTIMSHVVTAGYGYADYIRDAFSLEKGAAAA